MAPTASSVISPWARALVQPPSTSTIATIAEHALFVLFMEWLRPHSLNALVVLGRGAGRDLHGFHLLDVLGVQGFGATQRGLVRYSVFGREVVENVILAGQETWDFAGRNDGSVWSDLAREGRDHLVG